MTKVLQNALWGPPLPTLFAGLTLAWASTTTITVNTGITADSTLQRTMKLTTALTKSTSGWAAGNAGGLDTGTIAANTGYHWYLIFNQTTGAMDVVFSATTTPLAGPTAMPSGYTHFKWIWWTKTNASSQWISFLQDVEDYHWSTPQPDYALVAPTTSSTLYALSVPAGIKVKANYRALFGNTSSGSLFLWQSPSENTQAANTPAGNGNMRTDAASVFATANFSILTDANRQVQGVSSISSNNQLWVNTYGWTVPRASVR